MHVPGITNRPPNPHGGSIIFGLQLLLVILVPLVDDGRRLAPLPYMAAMLAVQSLTVLLLGYRRTGSTIAVAGGATL